MANTQRSSVEAAYSSNNVETSLEARLEGIIPSVVSVGGYSKVRLNEEQLSALPPQFAKSLRENKPLLHGSGFFVSENLIATNRHVVESDKFDFKVKVTRADGTLVVAEVVEKIVYPKSDFALLRIKEPIGTPVELGDSSTLKPGRKVFALGNSMGMFDESPRLTDGIISSNPIQQIEVRDSLPLEGVFATTAAILPGNSGGPLFEEKTGKVVGINTAGMTELPFVVPINEVKPLIEHHVAFSQIFSSLGELIADRNAGDVALEPAVHSAIRACNEILKDNPSRVEILRNPNVVYLLDMLIEKARARRKDYIAMIENGLGVTMSTEDAREIEDDDFDSDRSN